MDTLVVNFFGGPGTGKSSTTASVFSALKWENINCEMALEFAKDKVWERSAHVLDNQLYVFGKQYHRIYRLLDQVDVILTDAPLLNSILYYSGENPHFNKMVFEEHRRLRNVNIFLQRLKPYNPSGRLQDETKAKALDHQIVRILDYLGEDYLTYPADPRSIPMITKQVCLELFERIYD
ncbi:MAG: AAA family ATPase [Candidatus Bathyarchaeia archaeon]